MIRVLLGMALGAVAATLWKQRQAAAAPSSETGPDAHMPKISRIARDYRRAHADLAPIMLQLERAGYDGTIGPQDVWAIMAEAGRIL